jgi:FKBP-type peptidyl-prolyl cis-trans isomerase (trigger factor)
MKVNYLNNKDLLEEIHKSKTTFCTFTKKEYHRYDLILPSIDKINIRTIAEAKRAQAKRLGQEAYLKRKEAGEKVKLAECEVDYKKIAKKENSEKAEPVEATEKELEETIEEIRKNYAMRNHPKSDKESDGASTHAEGEEHKEGEKLDLPEVNEEWVKKLGAFETVEDFKNKIRDGIRQEKEFKAKDKKRMAIIEKVMEESKISLPKVLVES